jgi:hypothetical protein
VGKWTKTAVIFPAKNEEDTIENVIRTAKKVNAIRK